MQWVKSFLERKKNSVYHIGEEPSTHGILTVTQ